MTERDASDNPTDTQLPAWLSSPVVDRYGGVSLHIGAQDSAPVTEEDVRVHVPVALRLWKQQGRCAAWLRVDQERADLVGVAVAVGFDFHHARSAAESERAYIMLTRWLKDGPNKLPPQAHSMIGVGGWVDDGDGNVLVVQDRYFEPAWKLPGGLVDRGEDLRTAVQREVFEETGLHVIATSVIAFRTRPIVAFGNTDHYFVIRCRLRDAHGSRAIHACEDELLDAQWMPVTQYVQHELVNATNRRIARCAMLGASSPNAEYSFVDLDVEDHVFTCASAAIVSHASDTSPVTQPEGGAEGGDEEGNGDDKGEAEGEGEDAGASTHSVEEGISPNTATAASATSSGSGDDGDEAEEGAPVVVVDDDAQGQQHASDGESTTTTPSTTTATVSEAKGVHNEEHVGGYGTEVETSSASVAAEGEVDDDDDSSSSDEIIDVPAGATTKDDPDADETSSSSEDEIIVLPVKRRSKEGRSTKKA